MDATGDSIVQLGPTATAARDLERLSPDALLFTMEPNFVGWFVDNGFTDVLRRLPTYGARRDLLHQTSTAFIQDHSGGSQSRNSDSQIYPNRNLISHIQKAKSVMREM